MMKLIAYVFFNKKSSKNLEHEKKQNLGKHPRRYYLYEYYTTNIKK